MVHKKYIKRGDKFFGPYLYENYRENGVIKTRYLGIEKKKSMNIFAVLIVILFISLLIGLVGLFTVSESKEYYGELTTSSPFSFLKNLFTSTAPINVFVQIISNNPPEFLTRPSEILVCENTAIERGNVKLFVRDPDGDILDLYYNHLYTGRGIALFFDPNPVDSSPGGNWVGVDLYSREFNYNDINRRRSDNQGWAVYPEKIIVTDGNPPVDSFDTNVFIIEVNDAPKFNISVQTIDLYLKGENTSFYYDLGSYLESVGEETPKDQLIYNLTYSNGSISPFNINDFGVINITGNESYINPGENATTYDLRVSVNDTGLVNEIGLPRILHSDISICLADDPPQDESPKNWSDEFSLTITKQNRPPIITSYYPSNISFHSGTNESFNRSLIVKGTDVLYFNLTAYDSDWTPLDVYWHVDNVSEESYEGLYPENVSKFEHFFGCGISGEHVIKAVVTDGLLNDLVEWNFAVEYVGCPEGGAPGGGGGGGGRVLYCEEKWGCGEWIQCVNLEEMIEGGWVSKETELIIKERCKIMNYTNGFCGFQTRECIDLEDCKTEREKPGTLRECYYTENPTCEDGIKNCHDESCEVLVDCGGPCEACPTCSDKIQNQGEERIDCGGPCKPCVELPWATTAFKLITTYSLLILFILILFLVVRELVKYGKFKGMFGRSRIKNLLIRGKEKSEERGVRKVIASLFFIGFVIVLLFFANTYIMNVADVNRVVADVSEVGGGFVASYGLINSFFKNLVDMFVVKLGVSIIGTNADLFIWSDTDNIGVKRYTEGILYGKTENDWNVYFHANYTTKTGEAISTSNGNGDCNIQFYDSNYIDMFYNSTSQLWEYNRTFIDKGTLNFDVDCTSTFENLNLPTDLEITNTPPQIALSLPVLEFGEDNFSNYNFSQKVFEDDKNDVLSYLIINISGNEPSLYNWIWMKNEFILINATSDDEAGSFDLGIEVIDSSNEAVSRIQMILINPVNDPPIFVNLDNQTLDAEDLFEYIINISDEEDNFPFSFEINFEDCSPGLASCILFDSSDYEIDDGSVDGIGKINISFTPASDDVGWYIVNFSVTDTNALGNEITSQLVNFTVITPIWKDILQLDYLLIEDELRVINLSSMTVDEGVGVVFSYELVNSEFPSFSSSFNGNIGIINITPFDEAVGYNEVIITATKGVSSQRTFNFTVLNINDNVSIQKPLGTTTEGVNIDFKSNVEAYENMDVNLLLYVRDDDFLIPDKTYYDENLTLDLNITGPNLSLFEFSEVGWEVENLIKEYSADFSTIAGDVGNYNITINISDANNSFDILRFNLTIRSRDYDKPNITFPDEVEFNLIENITSNLTFRANHSVGDNLTFEFYINDILRDSFLDFGDNRNVTWQFTPNFTDETYGEKANLTLIVKNPNPLYPDLKVNRTWNITINHTNAPPQHIRDIGDKSTAWNDRIEIDLSNHFTDIDHYDIHYNQTFEFEVVSNLTENESSNIGVIEGDSEWKIILLPLNQRYTKELLNISMHDLNETDRMSNATSNYFWIEFKEPKTVVQQVPSGGSTQTIPIALKIIMPGQISAYEGEILKIPIQLVNSGKREFRDLTLNSSAFKNGSLFDKIETSLDKTYFKTLKPGDEENLTLTVYFGDTKVGKYEITVSVTSKSPTYTDWGKIHIDLQPINESQVRELIVFTEEFIAGNPQCIEISELIEEAEKYFTAGDYNNARAKAEEALNSCKEAITQTGVPRLRIPDFMRSLEFSLYLAAAIVIAIIMGLIYYFIKRRKIQKLQAKIQETRQEQVQ